MRRTGKYKLLAIFLLTLQFFFWWGIPIEKNSKNIEENISFIWNGTKSIKVELEVLPKVPSKEIFKATSFGDEEMGFRYNSYILQFAGDTFGRITPLKDYDYKKLHSWWMLLDEVNSVSDLLAYMVAYYYSSSQTPKLHVPYVVDFLEKHSDKHPEDKWWWYSQAAYNAKFKLEDKEVALRISKKLANLPKDLDIPIWTRQLEAFIYEDSGEYEKACDIIVNVIKDFGEDKLTEGEMNFIHHFLQERLRALIDAEENKAELKISDECRFLMEAQKATDLKARGAKLQ